MSITNHKCPNCEAGLPFNPEKGLWVCEYCKSEFTEEELNSYTKKSEKKTTTRKKKEVNNENIVEMDMYRCPSCGAEILTDENTTATFCVYCKNPAIIKERFKGEFNPDYIIPFKKTKQDAIEAFSRFSKGKLFTPDSFTDYNNIQEISSIYIPFWLYTCDVNGEINVDARKVRSWRSGDYRYTETSYYDVTRNGELIFDRVPTDGSTEFDDNIMDSIEPYDYSEMTEFNMSYLSGFLSEHYDVNKDDSFERAENRIKETTKNYLNNDIHGYTSKTIASSNITIDNLDAKYVLLPVWLLNTKYNDKIYTFALNGQTGKMVGNIPICKKKLIIKSSIVAGLTAIITALITYFG
ncbi:MAG: DNA helicase PriA [Clostridiales bacterium]|nr:DNA helicase PriA [Clostridiales bacterium]